MSGLHCRAAHSTAVGWAREAAARPRPLTRVRGRRRVAFLVLRAGDEPAEAPVAVDLEALPEPSPRRLARLLDAGVPGGGRGPGRSEACRGGDRERRLERGRLPPLELPRADAHSRPHVCGESGVTLAKLMDYLPRSNDPGCSAGFAHGLVTGVGAQIDPRRPRRSGRRVHERRHALSALQLRARARPRVHADPRRPARAGSRPLPRPRTAAGGRTVRRVPITTTGSRSSAPTTRACRTGRSPIRGGCAAPSRPSSCGRAGTAPSSTTGPRGSWSTRPSTSTCSARVSTVSSVRRA